MRKPRTAHLWRLMFTILALTFLALGSFWLMQVMNQGRNGAPSDPRRNEPDYFVNNFSFVRMAKTGQPAYIVSGILLTHRPIDDSADIDKPFMRQLTPGQPPLDMHATHAHISDNNSRVQLNGNVIIDRVAGGTVQNMRLTTEALTVFPDSEEMQTDLPVVMTLGKSVMTGVGMKANNGTGRIEVMHNVHITYPPVNAENKR
ncbi:MAG TPA: LPS export ABC transporter periplasmic protein LptC [Janthinobacterium sp.]|jgi:lipopolysaccharide export system protein LptC|nr:LPS export ABC transporter periplasmic protein LptC [Janthinobacterium sp.]